jgi:hypothetical protein
MKVLTMTPRKQASAAFACNSFGGALPSIARSYLHPGGLAAQGADSVCVEGLTQTR